MSYSTYPSGPPSSGTMYPHSSSIIDYETTEAGSFHEPAPTISNVGTRNIEPQTVTQRNLNAEANHGQSPSRSDMRQVGGFSSASGNSGSLQSDAPNFDGLIRPIYSHPGRDNPNSVGQAPGISGQARPNHSESAQPSAEDQSPQLNPEDYVGISLVGKKFKEVHPSAYYVEK